MVIQFKAKGQKNPLLVTTKGDKKVIEQIKDSDLDSGKIKRKVKLSPEALDEHGQLFFEIVDGPYAKLGLGMLWQHLLDEKFIVKIEYPGGAKIESPTKEEVTVYKLANGIAIDVDAMQYFFPNELDGKPHIADPFIKDMTDPKDLIVKLMTDLLDRPDDKRPTK